MSPSRPGLAGGVRRRRHALLRADAEDDRLVPGGRPGSHPPGRGRPLPRRRGDPPSWPWWAHGSPGGTTCRSLAGQRRPSAQCSARAGRPSGRPQRELHHRRRRGVPRQGHGHDRARPSRLTANPRGARTSARPGPSARRLITRPHCLHGATASPSTCSTHRSMSHRSISLAAAAARTASRHHGMSRTRLRLQAATKRRARGGCTGQRSATVTQAARRTTWSRRFVVAGRRLAHIERVRRAGVVRSAASSRRSVRVSRGRLHRRECQCSRSGRRTARTARPPAWVQSPRASTLQSVSDRRSDRGQPPDYDVIVDASGRATSARGPARQSDPRGRRSPDRATRSTRGDHRLTAAAARQS